MLGLKLGRAISAMMAISMSLAIPQGAYAQVPASTPPPLNSKTPVDAPEDEGGTTVIRVDPKRQKRLQLFIGVEHQEPVPYIPVKARFKGDYKKITKLGIDRDRNILRFQPTTDGTGTLTIEDEKENKVYEFQIIVGKSTLTKTAQEIQSLLSDVEGITIKIINNRVVIDGQVLLPREMNRIIGVVAQFGDTLASSLVTLSPIAQRKIAQAIVNDINNPEITVRAINDKFILEGMASDQTEKDRADAIAQMYVPDVIKEMGEKEGTIVKLRKTFVLNLIQLKPSSPKDPGKIIQIVVHYVELNKNYEKSFRFQFTPTLEDKSTVSFTNDSRAPGGVISTLTGIVSNLLPKLNWAKSHGHARILKSSTIIVLDGQKGEIKNVVKVPYATVNGQGQSSTNFEEAGLTTTVTPAILNPRSDSIRLNVDFAMKSLLGQTDQGPMVSSNSMQTVIVVRSGQSAAVGGVISNDNGTDYNKLPKSNVASDPLISLYASKSFQRNQSQFVVFLTPIIKASASQGAEKVKQKFKLRD
jgi:pilus assembly protein CpaC